MSHSKKVERPGGGSNISIFFHGRRGYRLPDVDLCSAFHKGRLKSPELVRHRFRTALSKIAQEVAPTQPFLTDSAGFGQTHRQTHKKPLRPILNGLSGISIWSGRQDCFAISLRSSNPRCGLRRIAAARLLSNPAAHRQKNPSRKREGFNFGRGDRIRTCDPLLPKQMR